MKDVPHVHTELMIHAEVVLKIIFPSKEQQVTAEKREKVFKDFMKIPIHSKPVMKLVITVQEQLKTNVQDAPRTIFRYLRMKANAERMMLMDIMQRKENSNFATKTVMDVLLPEMTLVQNVLIRK